MPTVLSKVLDDEVGILPCLDRGVRMPEPEAFGEMLLYQTARFLKHSFRDGPVGLGLAPLEVHRLFAMGSFPCRRPTFGHAAVGQVLSGAQKLYSFLARMMLGVNGHS